MADGEPLITNRDRLPSGRAHRVALDCLAAGIEAADPAGLTRAAVSTVDGELIVDGTTYVLDDYDDLVVLGGGNAGGVVAAELASLLGDHLSGGVVVTDTPASTERIAVLRGDHPVPSERNVEATRRLLSAARAADDRTLVLGAITGGGSALMAAPAAGVSLADLQSTTEALLDSGATIGEINAVRKHCSAIKGGRLARALSPADVHALVVSDVVGNDLSTIASGPLSPDGTTFADALAVLDRYDCIVPEAVRRRLERGAAGEIEETPAAGDPAFDGVRTTIIGDNALALRAAADRASAAGFSSLVLSSRIRGEASEAAKTQVAVAEECRATGGPVEPPAVVVSGGETTVTVTGAGTGGPNQEFALSAAIELAGSSNAGDADAAGVVIAAVDSDGLDGPTDAAGGIVDAGTVDRLVDDSAGVGSGRAAADAAGIDAAHRALADNDAFDALARANALVETGPTGTNVNDLRVVVVPAADADLVDPDRHAPPAPDRSE